MLETNDGLVFETLDGWIYMAYFTKDENWWDVVSLVEHKLEVCCPPGEDSMKFHRD